MKVGKELKEELPIAFRILHYNWDTFYINFKADICIELKYFKNNIEKEVFDTLYLYIKNCEVV